MRNRFTRLRWTAIALLLIGLIAGIVMPNVVGDVIRLSAFVTAAVLLFVDYRQGRSRPR